jgi:hypothetical protein
MKKIQIEVPEKDYVFLVELLRHLGFQYSEEDEIPEEHKAIVRQRMRYTKKEDLRTWEESLAAFKFKGKE